MRGRKGLVLQDCFVKLSCGAVNLASVARFWTLPNPGGEPDRNYVWLTDGRSIEVSEEDLMALSEAASVSTVTTGLATLSNDKGGRVVVNLSKIDAFEPDEGKLYLGGHVIRLADGSAAELVGQLDYGSQASL